jgi:hypothetical protein
MIRLCTYVSSPSHEFIYLCPQYLKKIFLEHTDLIWDIEASKIRMKLDFPPIDSNIGVISVYNRSSKMLVTEVNEVLQLVDIRSGKIISPINIKARSTGFLDNNTMALTTTQGILKLDLRNFQQRSILTGVSTLRTINSYEKI